MNKFILQPLPLVARAGQRGGSIEELRTPVDRFIFKSSVCLCLFHMGQPIALIAWHHSHKPCICRGSGDRRNILWDSQNTDEAVFARDTIKVCKTKIQNEPFAPVKSRVNGLVKGTMGWY